MSIFLTPTETSKIVALLSMLDSPYDGERANAGLLVTRLIKSKGRQCADLIRPALASAPPPQPPPDSATRSRAPAGWRAQATRCLATPWLLSTWEIEFLGSITRQRRGLSERQEEVLARIVERLARRCGA